MRLHAIAVVGLLAAAPSWAGDGGTRLHFPVNGFSIEAIEATAPGVPSQPLTLALPPMDGFSPNLNVQVQPFAGTLAEYLALTREQLAAARFELLDEPVIEGSILTIEYAGPLNGRSLRWYAKATRDGERVYLVTATALRSQWEAIGAKLERAVDSFRLEGAE